MHIVLSLPDDGAGAWLEPFRHMLPDATVEPRWLDAPVSATAAQADYVVVAHRCTTLFDEHPAPKAIFTVSAGVGHVMSLPNLPQDVPLIRVEDAGMGAQMIRYVLAALLRFAQRFDEYAKLQQARAWQQRPPKDPAHIVVGILGMGVIGGAIADAVVALGFTVRGYTRTARTHPGVSCYAGVGELDGFLQDVNVLVNVLPETGESRGLLDRPALAHLAKGAHFVNIGRGSVVVEEVLLELLDSGQLAGATLDVFATEPLPVDHPFWSRQDITITPHVAGVTMRVATVEQIVGKIARLERGESVTGRVDLERGY